MREASSNSRRHRSKKSRCSGQTGCPSLIRRCSQRRKLPTNNVLLQRSASEPILWTVRFVSDGVPSKGNDEKEKPPLIVIPTFYSCFQSDLFVSSSTLPFDFSEEKIKVVVSVAVEGSVGPVKALVRLGATIDEMISIILERYKLEGRSPRLDPVGTSSFQLHHSHFSLQSLNKNDKIGEVGGRNFYLRKNCDLTNSYFQKEKFETKSNEIGLSLYNFKNPTLNPTQLFVSFVIKKYNKIKRRSKRLWRFLTCNQ